MDHQVPNERVTLSRQQLYEQVWTDSMLTLGARYGISDVGLAKICKRMKIPVPGRGYWAKRAAGQHLNRRPLSPLPPSAKESMREVTLSATRRPTLSVAPATAAQAAFEASPENRIVVSDALRAPHPLVRRTADAVKPEKIAGTSIFDWREQRLDIDVSRPHLGRALRIFDALLKAFERRGWKVSLGTGDDRKTYVALLDHKVPIGIRERLKQVKNEPAKRVRLPSGETYVPWQRSYENLPTGSLTLVIRNSWGYSVHKRWHEYDKIRLEDRLGEFVVGIVAQAEELREWHRGHEELEQRRLAEQLRRAEEERRREEAAARVRELERQAEIWTKRARVLSYISAVREAASPRPGALKPGSKLDVWLQWAEQHAQSLDSVSVLLAAAHDDVGAPEVT